MGCTTSRSSGRSNRQERRRRRYASQPLTINSFTIRHMLGEGFFSQVCNVRHKSTDKVFALKLIEKRKCITSGYVNLVIAEVQTLRAIQHDNIVKLWFTFYDMEHVCMGLECYNGGDLYYHKLHSSITAKASTIYLLEIGSALEYLKQEGIIHRDVKPDNIVLDMKGHAYLTDFNLTARFKPGERLFHQCGTREYRAPETRLKRGYSYAVDWWSLGYTIYEVTQKKSLKVNYYRDGTGANTELHYRRSVYDNCPELATAIKELLRVDEARRCTSLAKLSTILAMTVEEIRSGRVKPIFIPTNQVNVDRSIELEQRREGTASIYRKKKRMRSLKKSSAPAPDHMLECYHRGIVQLEAAFGEYYTKGLYSSITFDDESFELLVEVELAESEIPENKPNITRQPYVNEGASTSAGVGIPYMENENLETDDWKLCSNTPSRTGTLEYTRIASLKHTASLHPVDDRAVVSAAGNILPYTNILQTILPKYSLTASESQYITDTPIICMYDIKQLSTSSVLL